MQDIGWTAERRLGRRMRLFSEGKRKIAYVINKGKYRQISWLKGAGSMRFFNAML